MSDLPLLQNQESAFVKPKCSSNRIQCVRILCGFTLLLSAVTFGFAILFWRLDVKRDEVSPCLLGDRIVRCEITTGTVTNVRVTGDSRCATSESGYKWFKCVAVYLTYAFVDPKDKNHTMHHSETWNDHRVIPQDFVFQNTSLWEPKQFQDAQAYVLLHYASIHSKWRVAASLYQARAAKEDAFPNMRLCDGGVALNSERFPLALQWEVHAWPPTLLSGANLIALVCGSVVFALSCLTCMATRFCCRPAAAVTQPFSFSKATTSPRCAKCGHANDGAAWRFCPMCGTAIAAEQPLSVNLT